MPNTWTTAAWSLTALLLVMACPALAQPGPAPGSDPLAYTQEHAQDHAARALADPAAYAQQTASPDGIANETQEAGYIACWTAYEATGGPVLEPVCSAYFTPPGQATPPHEPQNATEVIPEPVQNVTAEVDALANTTLSAVEEIVEDPTTAPSQLERVAAAVAGFAAFLVQLVVDLVTGVVAAVTAVVDGVGAAFAAVASAIGATLDGIGGAIGATLDAVASAIGATLDAVASAIGATAGGIGGAADAVASAVGGAASTVADTVAGAAQAVGDGFAALADAVAGLWDGGAPAEESAAPRVREALEAPKGTVDGLVGDVQERLS